MAGHATEAPEHVEHRRRRRRERGAHERVVAEARGLVVRLEDVPRPCGPALDARVEDLVDELAELELERALAAKLVGDGEAVAAGAGCAGLSQRRAVGRENYYYYYYLCFFVISLFVIRSYLS